jgi:hypothetical protein
MPLPRSLTSAPHRDLDLELVSGRWPEGLAGELVISAPGPGAGLAYALFAPGHVARLSLQPGGHGAPRDRFAWRVRRIETPSARLAAACPAAFTVGPGGASSPFGFANQTNTAPLPWGDRLFTTWDVGRPVEIDAASLRFLGEVGSRRSWGPSLPLPGILPFIISTAHPVIDPERNCLWTVKLAPAAGAAFMELQPHVVRWDGDGPDVRTWPVAGAHFRGTMHTVSQTRDWLVLVDSGNFKPDPGEMAGGPRTARIDFESPVFLVRKEDLERTAPGREVPMRRFTIAPPTGHFYAVWDDTGGIRVLFEHMDGMDLGFFLRADDEDVTGRPIHPSQVGLYNMAMCPSTLSEVAFDVESGKTLERARFADDWAWNLQLSAMDWSPAGLAAPRLHHVLYQGYRPHNVSRRALAAYEGRFPASALPGAEGCGVLASFARGSLELRASFRWPEAGLLPTSPIFVPRAPGRGAYALAGPDPGGHDGWVVVPVLCDDGLRVDVFDAGDVGRGPLATLRAPGGACAPLLLHAAWLPAARPAPEAWRLRFSEDFDPLELDPLPPDLREAALRVARELDEEQPR